LPRVSAGRSAPTSSARCAAPVSSAPVRAARSPARVTTPAFLMHFGLESLRDLPDYDRLEEADLLGKAPLPDELREPSA
jgi:hypothetical protein